MVGRLEWRVWWLGLIALSAVNGYCNAPVWFCILSGASYGLLLGSDYK